MSAQRQETWRLLDTGEAPGAWNMAVDEALLLCVGSRGCPPAVRFFRWRPACLSLGYFQSARRDVDVERCRELGVDIVRRPTGGRAVFHHQEMTYSVAAPDGHPAVAGGVAAAYRSIAAGLVAGLRRLGADARLAPPLPPGVALPRSGACFDAAAASEVTVRGRKMVGSAQVRRDGAVLQHGALLLDFDASLYLSLFRNGTQMPAEELDRRVISLREALGRTVAPEEVAGALREGFQEALGVSLEPGELCAEERHAADELMRRKYGNTEWNLRR